MAKHQDTEKKVLRRFEKTISTHGIHIKLMMMIFLTCSLVYIISWSGHHYSIDGMVMFQSAKALLFRNSFKLDPPINWGMEIDVSKWAIGFTLIYTMILAGLSSLPPLKNIDFNFMPYDPDEKFNELLLYDPTYRYSSFINPFITAITAVFLYYLCIQLRLSKKQAAAAALVYGIASPAAVYAKLDFAQPLASLFVVLALIFFIRARTNGSKNLIASGVFLGLAVLSRTEMLIVPASIFVVAAYFVEPRQKEGMFFSLPGLKNILLISLPLIGFLLINQYINYLRFGSWFAIGYQPTKEFAFNVFATISAMVSNLVSMNRGVMLYFPLSILSIFGITTFIKKDRLIGLVLLFTVIGSWVMYSMWVDWDAGISWGPRFFIPIMPYLIIFAFFVLERDKPSPSWLITLFIISIILGAISSSQGLLFTKLTGAELITFLGSYSIKLDEIPFYIDLDLFRDPKQYDIRWLDVIGKISGLRNLVFFGCIFLLGFISKVWADFFCKRTDK